MEFFTANLAPIMFIGLMLFLLMGFPVAFSLGACGLFFGFVGIELGVLPQALMQALPLRIFGIMQNDTLLAIPFFTLMGLILERSGMAEDLLDTIGQLFGPVRGGLALAVVFVGALLAATTGVVAASVISMGLISLPIMLRYGYDRRIATGVIAASGTLAQIIPPSLVLIILADQLGRSVGDMYKGAFVPGFILMGFYAGYVILLALVKPSWVPALPPEARTLRQDNGKSGLPSLLLLTIDLSGAGHHFPGRGHAHRRRRHGCAGCLCDGDGARPIEFYAAQAGAQHHHQAVVLCGVHPDRLHHFQLGVPGCGRTALGGAPAQRPAGRADRLLDRGEHHDFLPGVLPRLL